jgi:hypothetical protein
MEETKDRFAAVSLKSEWLMSALGHKQTCAAQKIMSALHPKADMCGAAGNVR